MPGRLRGLLLQYYEWGCPRMKLLSLELKKVNIISYCIAAFAIFACLLGLTYIFPMLATKVSPTTYNTQKTVLPNFYKRKTLQSSKDYNASQTVFSCALDVYSSPVSTFLISFAVAVIICNPVSLIPSSSVSSCLRCVDLLATLSGKKN